MTPSGAPPQCAICRQKTLGTRATLLRQKFLALPVRRGDDEPVELGCDLDLTTKPRVGLHLIGKIQHIFFLVGRFAGQGHPFFVDVDMARRAGTAATAFGGDLWDTVADGGFHDRGAFLRLDCPGFAK
jgi:hypothetical protein